MLSVRGLPRVPDRGEAEGKPVRIWAVPTCPTYPERALDRRLAGPGADHALPPSGESE